MIDWLVSIIPMPLSSCICSLILNRELCGAIPSNWTEHGIVPIFKSKGSMIPNNYRTLMAKLYGSIQKSPYNVRSESFMWYSNLGNYSSWEMSTPGIKLDSVITMSWKDDAVNISGELENKQELSRLRNRQHRIWKTS